MAFDLDAMRTEVYARGFNYLDDGGAGTTRVTRWIVDAMHEIDELAEWPYLNETTTGTTPLTIPDLRTVEFVTDVGSLNPLRPADRRELRNAYADLTTSGQPQSYFITGGDTINVYPTNTSTTIAVDYWKVSPDLVNATDEPLMPDRFRMSIVHYAVALGHRDADNDASAQSARADGDQIVARMLGSLLVLQHQGAQQWLPAVGFDL